MASRLTRQVANDIPTGLPTGRHAGLLTRLQAGLRQGDDTAGRDTVKERVIQTAIAEPFMTVDEIARRVGTTAPYVRTTLSIAGLSLSDLRRRTAQELADRLTSRTHTGNAAADEMAATAIATATEPSASPATEVAMPGATTATAWHATPRVELRPEPAAAAILGVPVRQPLVALTYSWPTAGGRGHLGEILTPAPLELAELSGLLPAATSTETRPWRPLAPVVIRRAQRQSGARNACVVYLREVGLAGEIGSDGQELGLGWLQSTCVAEADGKPIAVERVAFDGARYTCRLVPSGGNRADSTDRPIPELVLS